MVDNGITHSYEAMRNELEGARYTEDENLHWHWRGGEFGAYTAIFPSIDSAYRHYQEGKHAAEMELQNAAMQALLEELYHGYVDSEPNYDIEPLEPFTNWLRRVKALLGKD